MTDLWNDSEIELLDTDLSDEDIATITGRTIVAVRRKRYKVIGHYTADESRQRDKVLKLAVPTPMSDSTKEARILTLAREMRVRLQG